MHSPESPYSAVNNDFAGIDVDRWRLFYSGSIGVKERWVLVISVVSHSFIANMPNKYLEPGVLFNIRYPSKIHFKLKSREISFAHNTCLSCFSTLLKLCTGHGNDIAVPIGLLYYWNGCYGRTRFREIWVENEFQTDIPYCAAPLLCSHVNVACMVQRLLDFVKRWVSSTRTLIKIYQSF